MSLKSTTGCWIPCIDSIKTNTIWAITYELVDRFSWQLCYHYQKSLDYKHTLWESYLNQILFSSALCLIANCPQLQQFCKLRKVIGDSRAVEVVYIDFSKGFDNVPHNRLIQKIKMLAINGDFVTWIQDWLTHRRQCCGGRELFWLEIQALWSFGIRTGQGWWWKGIILAWALWPMEFRRYLCRISLVSDFILHIAGREMTDGV